jgi:hypothetical protein
VRGRMDDQQDVDLKSSGCRLMGEGGGERLYTQAAGISALGLSGQRKVRSMHAYTRQSPHIQGAS